MEYGYGDDDTDYLTTQLDATRALLHLSYEGTREELIDFLFTSRDDYDGREDKYQHMPVHYIDSAGGLSSDLQEYSALNDPDD